MEICRNGNWRSEKKPSIENSIESFEECLRAIIVKPFECCIVSNFYWLQNSPHCIFFPFRSDAIQPSRSNKRFTLGSLDPDECAVGSGNGGCYGDDDLQALIPPTARRLSRDELSQVKMSFFINIVHNKFYTVGKSISRCWNCSWNVSIVWRIGKWNRWIGRNSRVPFCCKIAKFNINESVETIYSKIRLQNYSWSGNTPN